MIDNRGQLNLIDNFIHSMNDIIHTSNTNLGWFVSFYSSTTTLSSEQCTGLWDRKCPLMTSDIRGKGVQDRPPKWDVIE